MRKKSQFEEEYIIKNKVMKKLERKKTLEMVTFQPVSEFL